MSKRDEFITIIRTLTMSSLTITDKQRTRLLQQAVQDYGLSVEEATEILENLGLVVKEEVNYFDVLRLSIEEIQGLDEESIVDLIETAHKQHYSTSLRAGARIRPDGNTEEQWRNILNQARDTLKHAQKRREYITTYFSQKDLHSLPPSENTFPKAEPELSTTPIPIENQEKTFSPTTSIGVQLNQITKAFDTTVAVNDISLTIAPGELFFLLGPSGCGKSTLLRVLAGFYRPDAGELLFDGEVMNNVPPHQRNTGMVFQNYALWPHMTVGENIEYGLRLRKLEKSTRNEKITTVLEMVEMAEYRDRPVNTLSGGQQQRIALARALVIEPSVLLLDEPLSNLDAALRQNLRDEIKDIHSRTQITTLYVTHDQVEAISMADRMAIMKDGVFVQVGTPREIYQYPADPFVASFVGETNFITGNIQEISNGKATIETPVGVLHTESVHHDFTPGQEVSCSIRPETIHLNGNSVPNQLTAKVGAVTYLGRVEEYELNIADSLKLKAIIHNPGTETKKPGDTVNISMSPKAIVPLPTNH